MTNTAREQRLRELEKAIRELGHVGIADRLYAILADPVEVTQAMVDRSARVVCERAGEQWDSIGEFAQNVLKETQWCALTAALTEPGQ